MYALLGLEHKMTRSMYISRVLSRKPHAIALIGSQDNGLHAFVRDLAAIPPSLKESSSSHRLPRPKSLHISTDIRSRPEGKPLGNSSSVLEDVRAARAPFDGQPSLLKLVVHVRCQRLITGRPDDTPAMLSSKAKLRVPTGRPNLTAEQVADSLQTQVHVAAIVALFRHAAEVSHHG